MDAGEREVRLNEIIDSLKNCFDGNGEFAVYETDGNRAAQAFTTAVGELGMEPEQFIDLVVGHARMIYKDTKILAKAEKSIKDFVKEQLAE